MRLVDVCSAKALVHPFSIPAVCLLALIAIPNSGFAQTPAQAPAAAPPAAAAPAEPAAAPEALPETSVTPGAPANARRARARPGGGCITCKTGRVARGFSQECPPARITRKPRDRAPGFARYAPCIASIKVPATNSRWCCATSVRKVQR